MPHDAQRRHVVLQAHLVGQPQDPLHHCGDHVDEVGPVVLDVGEHPLGVEALVQHDVTACEQRLARPHGGAVVVQRAGHHHASVALKPERGWCVIVDDRRIARHDQLRPAGRAARRRRFPRGRDRVGERTVVEVRRSLIADRQADRARASCRARHRRRPWTPRARRSLRAREPAASPTPAEAPRLSSNSPGTRRTSRSSSATRPSRSLQPRHRATAGRERNGCPAGSARPGRRCGRRT